MTREYILFLKDILDSAKYILEFVEGMDFEDFLQDEKTRSAVLQKLQVIGEGVKYIPDSIQERYRDIPWEEMAGMRNRLIHGYFGIKYKLVWETVQKDIPSLISKISDVIHETSSGSE